MCPISPLSTNILHASVYLEFSAEASILRVTVASLLALSLGSGSNFVVHMRPDIPQTYSGAGDHITNTG